MATGTIKSYLADKSFGFIQTESGQSMFFHASAVKSGELDKVVRGARVAFEIGMKRGKEHASSVTVLAPPAVPVPSLPTMKRRNPETEELSEVEKFEREWGLRVVL